MTTNSSKPTVIIVEPHLEAAAGHPVRYVKALTGAFVSGGACVNVLASKRFPHGKTVGAPIARVFERPIYQQWNDRSGWIEKLANQSSRLRSRIGWLLSFCVSTIDALERPPGWVFLRLRAQPLFEKFKPLRITRLLLNGSLLAVGIILIGPFYILLSMVYALTGRSTPLSTLSPFARNVLKAVKKGERSSAVSLVVPTATIGILSELLALPVVHDGPLPSLYMIFHDEPMLWANWYRPTTLDGVAARMKASGWGPRIHFYTTTEAAAEQFRNAFGPDVYVRVIEDIFAVKDLEAIEKAGVTQVDLTKSHSQEADLRNWIRECRNEGLQIAVIPGPLRLDKGARDLPTLVAALDSREGKQFALIIQKGGPEWLASSFRRASTHSRVCVLDLSLSDALMHGLMSEADIVLLPYVRENYATRISSVLNEAILHAKPVLASDKTSLEAGLDRARWCRFLPDWCNWPSSAVEAINAADVDRGALENYAADFRRHLFHRPAWHTLVHDVLAPSKPLYAKAPMILVRPPWLKSGSARLQDDQLAYFASERRPILEIIVEQSAAAKHRRWFQQSILEDRAKSPSGIVCFTTAQSGLIPRLIFFARYGIRLLRSTYTGQLAEMSRLCPMPEIALRIARAHRSAFVLVHHYVRIPFIAPLSKFMPVWLETQDVQAVLHVQHGYSNMITGNADAFSTMLREEMRWVGTADAVVAISESELPTFQKYVGADKVFFCQPPISVPRLIKEGSKVEPFDILLVASDNPGNLASLKWFIEHVWTTARTAGLTCKVVGNINWRVQQEQIDPRGIEFVGAVEHLAPWYAAARVVAIPTTEGTGIGIKTVEAMAAGAPIVATTLAYRGLPSTWEKPSPIDSAPAFAAELIQLCTDSIARKVAARRVRDAYVALDLENRYRKQMRAIEAHVLSVGVTRFNRPKTRERNYSNF